ncbi:MAG: hypothetical protein IT338_17600 [Thermomicrobiales bacterium]|nr:hypothetical protein [Thermomicrobiales bacterium]
MTPAQKTIIAIAAGVACGAAFTFATGCEAPPERRARHLVEQAGGGPTTCVTADSGENGDDISFCTNGVTLTICVQGGGCITVAAPAERLSP